MGPSVAQVGAIDNLNTSSELFDLFEPWDTSPSTSDLTQSDRKKSKSSAKNFEYGKLLKNGLM